MFRKNKSKIANEAQAKSEKKTYVLPSEQLSNAMFGESPGKVIRRSLRRTFMATTAASVLTSLFALHAGEDMATDNLNDYLDKNKMSKEIFEGQNTDNIKVYKKSFLATFHYPAAAIQKMHHTVNQDKDASAVGKTITKVFSAALGYPVLLSQSLGDAISYERVNAFALGGENEGTAYIRPPANDITAAEMVKAFTGIPKSKLSDMSKANKHISPFIMMHEILHTGQTDNYDLHLNTDVVEREILSDAVALHKFKQHLPADEYKTLENVILYARAMSPFSRGGFDKDHATALAIQAWRDGETIPTKQEILYANMQLREVLAERIVNYDKENKSYKRYIAAYQEMKDIAKNGAGEYSSPLVQKAAALYVEAAEYLSPGIKNYGPQPKKRATSDQTQDTGTQKQRDQINWGQNKYFTPNP